MFITCQDTLPTVACLACSLVSHDTNSPHNYSRHVQSPLPQTKCKCTNPWNWSLLSCYLSSARESQMDGDFSAHVQTKRPLPFLDLTYLLCCVKRKTSACFSIYNPSPNSSLCPSLAEGEMSSKGKPPHLTNLNPSIHVIYSQQAHVMCENACMHVYVQIKKRKTEEETCKFQASVHTTSFSLQERENKKR